MKIVKIWFEQIEGVLNYEGEQWEERLVRPVDIYPEHRSEPVAGVSPPAPRWEGGGYLVSNILLFIETDGGAVGLCGPIDKTYASFIESHIKPLLLGEDPRRSERIWDRLYRSVVSFGNRGITIMAISVVDNALWDLKGKLAGLPVYRLLGGPVREKVPAYASALGYSLDPEKVQQRVTVLVADGYRSMKWFFRYGPGSGLKGMEKNLELVRTLRETAGNEIDLMFDCWSSWDVPYALAMADKMTEFRPRWIEEPFLPDRFDSCAALRRGTNIPVATGEHVYTRWSFKKLLDAGAADVIQPDIMWAGGISEVIKICAIASTFDVQVIPHTLSAHATLHLIASQPENLCPYLEYLINHNRMIQFFFKTPIVPVDGFVTLPEGPGLGIELDEHKIRTRREISWRSSQNI